MYRYMYEVHNWTALWASEFCFYRDPTLFCSAPLCIESRLCYGSNFASNDSLGIVSEGWAYCEKSPSSFDMHWSGRQG